jgi:hypothetical protein
MEAKIYNMTEEVKNIVMGVEQYRCRVNLNNHFRGDKIDKDFFLKRAEDKASYDLLDGIKQFIKIEQNLDRGYVEAELFLPYVRDSKIKELEDAGDFWRKSAMRSEGEIIELCKKIRLLERPWWKKLLGIDK